MSTAPHDFPTSTARPRRSARAAGVLAIWCVILAALVPSTAAASTSDEAAFIASVNATRAGVGLPPLQPDVQLTNLARGWAGSMRDGVCGDGAFICHASPISAGVTHPWAKLGENVGTGPDVGSIMDAFVASPGHYANIVDPEFTHIGVGVVWDGNRMYTTHRFMKLQSSPTTTTSPATTTPTTVAPTTAAPTSTAPPATTAPTTAAPTTSTTPPVPEATARPNAAQPAALLEERAATVLDAIGRLVRQN